MIRLRTTNNKDICCFVASTPEERNNGLNDWGRIPLGSGLLFDFKEPDYVIFHMDRVWFPIDIVMLDANANVNQVYVNCQPGALDKFPGNDVKWVLELPANDTIRLGIGVGTSLRAHSSLYEFNQRVRPELLAVHAAYNGFCESGVSYGAVIAYGNNPVSWGWNKTKVTQNPTSHAEMVAISDAIARGVELKGSTMFSTSQPCMMCAGAAAWSEIASVQWLQKSLTTVVKAICKSLGNSPIEISHYK